jgi:hypothetical protein
MFESLGTNVARSVLAAVAMGFWIVPLMFVRFPKGFGRGVGLRGLV